jgi:ABC-type taurine transport system substrate-binding protein
LTLQLGREARNQDAFAMHDPKIAAQFPSFAARATRKYVRNLAVWLAGSDAV